MTTKPAISLIAAELEAANARGVGQFHIVKGGHIVATHRGFESTCVLAAKQGAEVYNSDGDRVFPVSAEDFALVRQYALA